MPLCSRCGEPRDRPGQRYCRACHNAYRRAKRPKYHELSEEEKQRSRCRAYTNVLVKRGVLKKQSCRCGSEDVEAHHHDYTKPREVEWICRPCHMGVHDRPPPKVSLDDVLSKWA